MDRVILHCDMNAFFASVELLDYPHLQDKAMAVCGNPENRHGIILAKNQKAKEMGIRTAETLSQALKKCPDLEVVPPHHDKYKYYNIIINDIYYRYTDMVEPFSIDESWLDLTSSQALFGSGKEIADHIRQTVKTELGLSLSVGISFNKVFAKMGSEYKKPDASTEISRGNFKDILWPLPVGDLFTVGQVMAGKLNAMGIQTIGDLAKADSIFLYSNLGKQGLLVWQYANGLDQDPVSIASARRAIKSVGNGITFSRNLISEEDLSTAITGLSDTVAARLRQYQLKAWGIKVDIKDPFFNTISRQIQLERPTNLAPEISRVSKELVKKALDPLRPIRLLTVTGINLTDENTEVQISLFPSIERKQLEAERLERTLDKIRSKYGDGSVHYASLLDNDLGIDLEEIREED